MANTADILLPIAGAIAGLSPYLGSAVRTGATVADAMGQRDARVQAEEEAQAAAEAEARRRQRMAQELMQLVGNVDDPRARAVRAMLMGGGDPSKMFSSIYQLLEPAAPGQAPRGLPMADAQDMMKGFELPEGVGSMNLTIPTHEGVTFQPTYRAPGASGGEEQPRWSVPKQLDDEGYLFVSWDQMGNQRILKPQGDPPQGSDAAKKELEITEAQAEIKRLEGDIRVVQQQIAQANKPETINGGDMAAAAAKQRLPDLMFQLNKMTEQLEVAQARLRAAGGDTTKPGGGRSSGGTTVSSHAPQGVRRFDAQGNEVR